MKPRPASSGWREWGPPVGLFLLALFVRVSSLLGQGFDGLYGQDPFAYFGYAIGPLRAPLLSLKPWPPFFWPPGFPLLITLGSLLFGASPLVGQWISLLAGSLVPAFTYALAREIWLDLQGSTVDLLPPSLKGRGAGGVRSFSWVP